MRTHRIFALHLRFCTVLGALATALLLSSPAASQPYCMTNCTGTVGVSMNCVVTGFPCNPQPTLMGMSTTLPAPPVNASCVGLETMAGNLVATAVHMAGQGTPATCVFAFMAVCQGGVNGTVTCTVDSAADGLPIELMEFSIEDEAEETEPGDGEHGR